MSVIEWTLDLWDGGGSGLRLAVRGDENLPEIDLLFSAEKAEERDLKNGCIVEGDEADVFCFFGIFLERQRLIEYLSKALMLLSSIREEGVAGEKPPGFATAGNEP